MKDELLPLLVWHSKFMIGALSDDLNVNYSKRIVMVELMALEHGWRHLVTEEQIALRLNHNNLLQA
jgi:hypothetical protein